MTTAVATLDVPCNEKRIHLSHGAVHTVRRIIQGESS